MSSDNRASVALLAIALLCFQMVLPFAAANASGSNQFLICSDDGVYSLSVNDKGEPVSQAPGNHCKLCLLSSFSVNAVDNAAASISLEVNQEPSVSYIIAAQTTVRLIRHYDALAPPFAG